jgi:hypothetical protein
MDRLLCRLAMAIAATSNSSIGSTNRVACSTKTLFSLILQMTKLLLKDKKCVSRLYARLSSYPATKFPKRI